MLTLLDPVNDPWNESPVDNVDNARGGYCRKQAGSKTHFILTIGKEFLGIEEFMHSLGFLGNDYF